MPPSIPLAATLTSGNRYDVTQLIPRFRRLRIRWEIRDDIHDAFLTLGCALICWRRLQSLR